MLIAFVALATLVSLAVGLALLFLPTLIAKSRHHPNTLAIFLVNLFFGWTFAGWVVALIWACTRPVPPVLYAPVYPTIVANSRYPLVAHSGAPVFLPPPYQGTR
jgi:hypothetical protein